MTATSDAVSKATIRTLKGWLEIPNRKLSQNLRFFRLRGYQDAQQQQEHSYQLISRHAPNSSVASKLNALTSESCIRVTAKEIQRPEEAQRKQEGLTGEFDYEIEDVEVLNLAAPNLPFLPNNESLVDNAVRAQSRHLDMRSKELGSALRKRARIRTQLRNHLEQEGFMEVETPLLFKSTPEGAREFLVPTRKRGQFFALPQSPQQYKQILMAGGIHRYYQFAKCFRDEDSRADRQLEFTQLDLEMAFVEMEDVMAAISKIVLSVRDGNAFDVQPAEIPRMRYNDAMRLYGSDKPDLRFGLMIESIETGTEVVDIIRFPLPVSSPSYSNKLHKTLQQSLREIPVTAVHWKGGVGSHPLPPSFDDIAPHFQSTQKNPSIILLARRAGRLSGGSTDMGQARLKLQSFLEQHEFVESRQSRPFKLTWITDFPLFSPSTPGEPGQSGTVGLSSTHHPFTAPHPDDIYLLDTVDRVHEVRGLHYDLVMNGVEIGGGSIRIHSATLQRRVFQVLGMTEAKMEQFNHLLRVLDSGCPPHGGFALGFDRFVAMLCDKASIRDVIAFPKTGSGIDPLIGSPSVVDEATMKEYHIQTIPTKVTAD